MNKKIAVIGANGQLGSQIRQDYPEAVGFDFPEFNLLDRDTWDALEKLQPNIIINCAAFTNVDKAESDREAALALNATAAGDLASYCSEKGIKLVHISTDFVFDRNNEQALSETDTTNPVNYYGESKLAGEKLVLENCPDSLIVRTAWLYGMKGPNFILKMKQVLTDNETVKAVTDQVGCPTYTKDLSEGIFALLEANQSGLFHCVNDGYGSKYDLVVEIDKILGTGRNIERAVSSNFPSPAERPKFSVLSTEKIKPFYQPRVWQEALKDYLQSVQG